jgi:hypothetical protein
MKCSFLRIMHALRNTGVICKITAHSSQDNFNFLIVYCESEESDLLGCYTMSTVTNDHRAFIFSVKLESKYEGNKLDPEDDGTTILRKICNYITNDTA